MERDVLKRSVVLWGQGGEAMSVASFVASQRTEHAVPHALTCRALAVSDSSFFKWRDREPTARQRRRADLDAAVKASFGDSDGTRAPTVRPGCGRTWSRPAGGGRANKGPGSMGARGWGGAA